MAITTVQAGSSKLRAVVITAKAVLGPGGTVLTKGMTVRVPVADAYTLVSGEQAKFIDDDKKSPVPAEK